MIPMIEHGAPRAVCLLDVHIVPCTQTSRLASGRCYVNWNVSPIKPALPTRLASSGAGVRTCRGVVGRPPTVCNALYIDELTPGGGVGHCSHINKRQSGVVGQTRPFIA